MTDATTVAFEAAKNWALMYPIPAWGLAEGEGAEKLAANWARVVSKMVLDALAEAGRLLPDAAEVEVHFGVHELDIESRTWLDTECRGLAHAKDYADSLPWGAHATIRRRHCIETPWEPFEEGDRG